MSKNCSARALTSCLAIVVATSAPHAFAQDRTDAAASPVQDTTLNSDDIVITAQKKDERLLEVPVSVTALASQALTQQNLVQLRDYYSRVPSLQISGGGTEQRASSLSIRGVTAGSGTAATVAITVDDVPFTSSSYLAQSPLPDLDPSDLDHIEVLRGPQGTLYGASSLGGLIKFVTAQPDTKDWSGRIEAGTNLAEKGRFGYSARGALNVPLASGRLALRISGFRRQDPAYLDNNNPLVNRKDINDNRTTGGRAALFARPFDALTFNFSVLRQHADTRGSPSLEVCASCGSGPFKTPVRYDQINGDLVSDLGPTTRKTDFLLYQARAALDLGFADLTSISAWGRYTSTSDLDTTNIFGFLLRFYGQSGTLGPTTPLINADRTAKFSQEVRLSSKDGGPLEWLIGGFYTKEHIRVEQTILVRNASGADIATALASVAPSTSEEKAGFADLTYKFTSKFDVQGGIRYSEIAQGTSNVTTIDPKVSAIFGPNSVTPFGAVKEHSTTWLITPRYRFSPDSMIYARVATGYRPGGPNSVLPNIPARFGSDSVTSYELGLKGRLPNFQLTYSLSAFQVNWKNIQLAAADVATQFGFFTNGSTARSRGIELETEWRPATGLVIGANAAFTDAKLTADIPQPVGASTLIGSKGERLPGSAKFTGNLSLQQDWQVGNGFALFLGGNLTYVGPRLGDFPNIVPSTPNAAFGYRLHLPSYALADLRAGVSKEGWRLNFYVRNLFDTRGVVEATTRGGTSSPRAVFAQPRTYGLSVSRTF